MIKRITLAKNEETFTNLSNYIPGFNIDRAISVIGLYFKSEEQCRKYTEELRFYIAKAKVEQENLKILQQTYNLTFPSDNKYCLTTPHIVYNNVISTLCEMKRSILRFCPRNSHRAYGTYSTTTQTLSTSFLCNKTPYTSSMFTEEYPDYVKDMLNALDEYMSVATENINICTNLIEEEKTVRENDELLKEIDEKSRKEIRNTTKALVKMNAFRETFISSEDLARRKKEAKDMNEMRRQLYHNITWTKYKINAMKDVVMEGMNHDLSAEEASIWTNASDYDFVLKKVRPVIEAMSKSNKLPSTKKRNSETERIVRAKFLAHFMKWCRVPKMHYTNFFNYLKLKFADAPLQIPSYNTICSILKEISESKENEFEKEFEGFLQVHYD